MKSRTGCQMSITILLPRNKNCVVGSDSVIALYLTSATSYSVGKITIYLISASSDIREAAAIAIDFHHYAVQWSCDRDLFRAAHDHNLFSANIQGAGALEWLLGSYIVIYLKLHSNNYFGDLPALINFY